MPQLHCYLRESLAKRVQGKAQMSRLSVSRYLASLIEKDVGAQWPENYFGLFGGWRSDDDSDCSSPTSQPGIKR